MADNQKYYYMRLKEDFFDSEEMKLLESLPDGYLYSNILLKLYLMSLKKAGRLMFNERIPYNAQMIATLTRHQVGTVEKALGVLKEFGFIEVLDSGAIYMLDIQSFIGQSSTEADRKREYRAQIAAEKNNGYLIPPVDAAAFLDMAEGEAELTAPVISGTDNQTNGGTNVRTEVGQMSDERSREIRDKRLEIRDKRIEGDIGSPQAASTPPSAKSKPKIDYQAVVDLYNTICVQLPRVKSLSEDRKKAIRARMNTYGMEKIQIAFEKANASPFLIGKNTRNWTANFDWLMKDSNMAKVLDGNYDDASKPTRTEAVPSWAVGEAERNGLDSLKRLRDQLRTAGNDEEVRARAERLKQRIGSE